MCEKSVNEKNAGQEKKRDLGKNIEMLTKLKGSGSFKRIMAGKY